MPITATVSEEQSAARIFITRYGDIDPKALKAELAARAIAGQVTARDERLLEYLRELHVLSLNQVQRLLWPDARPRTAYNRLAALKNYRLISYARVPAAEMRRRGLPAGRVYALNLGGWMWLQQEVSPDIVARSLRREQILHDLLVAEVCVRVIEATRRRGAAWEVAWAGDEASAYYERREHDKKTPPDLAPDGLAVIRRRSREGVAALPLFLEMDTGREAHGRPSSDWGRKVGRYNLFAGGQWRQHPQLADLPAFPAVAVITHGEQRLLNLAHAIQEHRKTPVGYYLALWDDLTGAEDILSAPVWLMLKPDGDILGRERNDRRALLPPVAGERG